MNYSSTQLENLGKGLGFLLMISGHQVDDNALSGFLTVVGAVIGLGVTSVSWIRRWMKGGVTFSGFREDY